VPGAGTRRGDAARQRVRYRQPRREMPMFEYQVVPVVVTRGAGVSPRLSKSSSEPFGFGSPAWAARLPAGGLLIT